MYAEHPKYNIIPLYLKYNKIYNEWAKHAAHMQKLSIYISFPEYFQLQQRRL